MDKLQELMLTTGYTVVYNGEYEFDKLKELFVVLQENDYEWIDGEVITVETSAKETIEKCAEEKMVLFIDENKTLYFDREYNETIKLDTDNIIDLLTETGLNREERDVFFALKIIKNHCAGYEDCSKCVLNKERHIHRGRNECLFLKPPCDLKLTTKNLVDIEF